MRKAKGVQYTSYSWKQISASIMISDTMHTWRTKLIREATKTNAFLQWALQHDKRTLHHYYDMSIELDMIHEYLTEERIYRG